MNIPVNEIKSRSEYSTDADYQSASQELNSKYGLNDGYCYSICVKTGQVKRIGKMKNPPINKISKSDQTHE
jgi:hypothetical protein